MCLSNRRENVLALLQEKDICLIPVCPEQLGGMSTPRLPSERKNDRVIQKSGTDVTDFFESGAREALRIAKLWDCDTAILKAKSPSCGCGRVYDGSFSKTLVDGDGIACKLLKDNGYKIITEKEI